MDGSLKSVIIVGMILLISSCASQKMVEKKPRPNFQEMVLATGVDDAGELGVPQGLTNEFTSEDDQVISLLSFDNLSGIHKFRWEWISPDGAIYLDSKNYPVKVEQGTYLPKVTVWHQISLKNEPAADIPGQWTVKFFVDSELIDSKRFNVKRITDPLALPSDLSFRSKPDNWGLIIGIEKYNKLPKVDYARKDALIIKNYFNKVLGIPEENIISLIDGDATKAQIEGHLKNYIPANIDRNATLYVYFAGHGMPGQEKGEPYLVPYDADTRFIEQTGYKLISFYEDLNQLKIERSYVFLDSCFSGVASRAAEMLIKGARPAMFRVEHVEPPSSSIISLSATSTGQISNALPEKEHGLFTYYLLRGLKGDADVDNDGVTNLKEMYDFVYDHVRRESRRLQSEQTPTIFPKPDQWENVIISRIDKKS